MTTVKRTSSFGYPEQPLAVPWSKLTTEEKRARENNINTEEERYRRRMALLCITITRFHRHHRENRSPPLTLFLRVEVFSQPEGNPRLWEARPK
jgi:hypothetical protein